MQCMESGNGTWWRSWCVRVSGIALFSACRCMDWQVESAASSRSHRRLTDLLLVRPQPVKRILLNPRRQILSVSSCFGIYRNDLCHSAAITDDSNILAPFHSRRISESFIFGVKVLYSSTHLAGSSTKAAASDNAGSSPRLYDADQCSGALLLPLTTPCLRDGRSADGTISGPLKLMRTGISMQS